ncbi:MAG: type II toxin-antitoxin system Phd/YefM family antitoxin [Rhodocyclaceae bacterium]|nr:type II toxin-antitoxin system Phd/YefM family antitoxin [Rhodocyclaceae bacterium]
MSKLNDLPMVNVHEAKTHFSRLLDRAHAGEEIILAKAGRPYARLMPLQPQDRPRRQPGLLKGWEIPDAAFFDPLPAEELRLWEAGSPSDPLYRK